MWRILLWSVLTIVLFRNFIALWSFGSQRFYKSRRLKYVINTDKRVFNNSTDSLLPRKCINRCSNHPPFFLWHLFISIVYMYPDSSCSSQICFWWDHAVTVVLVHFAFLLTYLSAIPTAHWILQKIHSYHSHFLIIFLQPYTLQMSEITYFCAVCSWCYKQIGAELVVWPCTCTTIAPVYFCVMFFKTIFIWIMIKSFYLWKISFASAGINSIIFFFSRSVPTCCVKWVFMSGVKKSTAAAIIKLTKWLTFQSRSQLLLICVNFQSFYSFT